MKALLIIGSGGHGKVVADAALSLGQWERVAFVDDNPAGAEVLGLPVVGTWADVSALFGDFSDAAVAIGDARTRLAMLERCCRIGYRLPAIIHRSASVSRFASLGAGCVVFAQAAVNADTVVGAACIINTGATVDHECELGAGVHVCPGAHIAGNVRAGDRAWIGIGACVLQGVTIGADVVVGAGAVVVSDIPPGMTVMGIPARPREKLCHEP